MSKEISADFDPSDLREYIEFFKREFLEPGKQCQSLILERLDNMFRNQKPRVKRRYDYLAVDWFFDSVEHDEIGFKRSCDRRWSKYYAKHGLATKHEGKLADQAQQYEHIVNRIESTIQAKPNNITLSDEPLSLILLIAKKYDSWHEEETNE